MSNLAPLILGIADQLRGVYKPAQKTAKSLDLLHQSTACLAIRAATVGAALLDAFRCNAPLTIPAAGSVGADQQDGPADFEGGR